jgi:uncharacterized BrkB/YihY/UPF0761 family membrane protein
MSATDFQDRLERIHANSRHETTVQSAAPSTKSAPRKFNLVAFIVGVVVMSLGSQTVKFVNDNYSTIREGSGPLASLGCGLAAIGLFITGLVLMARALPRKHSASDGVAGRARQHSGLAKTIFSLIGLVFGATACLFMFVGNAGWQLGVTGQVDPNLAREMLMGSMVAAFLILAVALLIGFIGIFVRGLPMRRVPVFFFLGAMLLYTSFNALRIHPSDWPTFMAEFTRSFKEARAN